MRPASRTAGPAAPGTDDETVELEIQREIPGRVVLAEPDGTIHLGRNYEILRSDDEGRTCARVSTLPRSTWRRTLEISRLACRLMRQEVRALARLSDGSYVAANREGVFHGRAGDPEFAPSQVEDDGAPLRAPMRLTVGPEDVVLWGEYTSIRPGRPIRLYASRDGGRSFFLVHSLPQEEVLHVHNIVHDPGLGHYWVLAGDHAHEPGIARLSADLDRFEWFVKGEQRFRTVCVFDFGDRLVYATDTELETNALVALDKKTGRTEKLREFDGSCIYGCRFGSLYAITTTVEPSTVNRSPWASLWLSRDGFDWRRAWWGRKDRWNADLFQFGSVVLPTGDLGRETIVFSGQALVGLDGRTAVARLPDADRLAPRAARS